LGSYFFYKIIFFISLTGYKIEKKRIKLLVIGYWLLGIGYWLLVIGYWLLVIGYLGAG